MDEDIRPGRCAPGKVRVRLCWFSEDLLSWIVPSMLSSVKTCDRIEARGGKAEIMPAK